MRQPKAYKRTTFPLSEEEAEVLHTALCAYSGLMAIELRAKGEIVKGSPEAERYHALCRIRERVQIRLERLKDARALMPREEEEDA